MKRLLISLLILMLAMFGCDKKDNDTEVSGDTVVEENADNDSDGGSKNSALESYKFYPVEAGVLEYELSGFNSGTKTVYFDDWGKRTATYEEVEVGFGGFTEQQSTFTLFDHGMIYTVTDDVGYYFEDDIYQNWPDYSPEELGMIYMESDALPDFQFKKTGTDTVAGRECTVWEMAAYDARTCIDGGMMIDMHVSVAGITFEQVLTSFEEVRNVPEEKFALPDIEFTKAPDIGDYYNAWGE